MGLDNVVEDPVEGFVLGELVRLDQGFALAQLWEVAQREGLFEVADDLVVVWSGGEEGESIVGGGDGGCGGWERVEVEGERVGGVEDWAVLLLLCCCECAREWDGSDAEGGFGYLGDEGGGSD